MLNKPKNKKHSLADASIDGCLSNRPMKRKVPRDRSGALAGAARE